jgi:hypothetical protein
MIKNDSKLSRHWIATREAVVLFLAQAIHDPNGRKPIVQSWLNGITLPLNTSPEDEYNAALKALDDARTIANDSGPNRRSARLMRMVQGAIGAKENGAGFYADVGELYPGDQEVLDYQNSLKAAAIKASVFIRALKNGSVGIPQLVIALQDLLQNNADINPAVWEAIRRLLKSMKGMLAHLAGSGEGSAFWPSTYISSSSGG